MKLLVYIESTIPSSCCEPRTQPEMVSRRHWTRDMRRINVLLGLHVPMLVTPLELMGE